MDTSYVIRKLSGATVGLALIALGVVLPNAAQAVSLTFITSRTELAGDDSVDWAVVGPAFRAVPNPFSVISSGGLELTVSKELGNFSTARQTSASDGPFSANFAPGDALITTTRQNSGPVTIAFNSPVSGAGTQVESFNNGPFDATIEALDSFGDILGSFSVHGTAIYGGLGDNTAPFVGVVSDSANISSLRINGERAPGIGFAFNQLDIVRTPISTPPVPEPEFPVSETGTQEALDSNGFILGSFSVPGTAIYGASSDNTAPFVGVASDSANIGSLGINGERASDIGLAFNQLDIVRTPISTPVPEPGFSPLSAIAFSGFLGAKLLLHKRK